MLRIVLGNIVFVNIKKAFQASVLEQKSQNMFFKIFIKWTQFLLDITFYVLKTLFKHLSKSYPLN
jgi:hypothetical protein